MATADAAAAAAGSAAAAATDLAGLPRPTTGRIFVLVIALLGIGLTAGGQIHTSVASDAWLNKLRSCAAQYPNGLSLIDAEGRDLTQCVAGIQQVHALFLAAGAALVIVGALTLIMIAPNVIRRRRGLKPAGPRAAAATARLADLAHRMGLRRVPALETAGPRQRDAYCFGRPGVPVIVLPLGIIARANLGRVFEPVVLHELAHIKHRDVALSWLARGFLAVAAVVALVPVLIAAVTADLSAVPDYLWRALLLVGVGWLVARAVLRTREFDADLAASRAGGVDSLRAVLAGPTARSTAGGWRRYLNHHPTPVDRLAVIDEPGRIATAGFASGLLPTTLVFAIVPSLKTIASVALTGVDTTAWLLPGIIVGAVLLAASVGIDVVRAARVEAGSERRHLQDGWVCVGAGAGALLGQVISPESAWLGFSAGVPLPALFFSGLLICGATAVACGIARAVSDRRIGGWAVIALTVVPWGLALWLGQSIQVVGELGLDWVRLQLLYNGAPWPAAVAAIVMIAMLAWALRRRGVTAALVGMAAAGCGAATMVVLNLSPLDPDDTLGPFALFATGVDQAALASLVAAAVLAALLGVRGAAEGGIAAAAAAITASAAFVVFLLARGNTIDGTLLTAIAMPMLGFPVAGWLAVAPIGLIGADRRTVPPTWLRALIAAVLTTTVVAIGSGIGPLLAPDPALLLPPTNEGVPPPAETAALVTGDDYRDLLAPGWSSQFETLVQIVDLDAEGPPQSSDAADLVDLVRPALATLTAQVDELTGAAPAVQSVHQDLVAAVAGLSRYLELTIAYHRDADLDAIRQARDARHQSIQDYQHWIEGLGTL